MDFRAVFLVLAVLACANPQPVSSDTGDLLSCGCGGGFTGGGQGGVIHRDGRILRWTMAQAGAERVETSLPENPDAVAKLFELIEKLRFEEIVFDHPHFNMRCSLTLTKNGSDHSVSWGDGNYPLPPELQKIVDEIEKMRAAPTRRPAVDVPDSPF
jgi:hypothetical protein